MEFVRRDAPFIAPKADVASIMRQVLYALIPATIAHVWLFGAGLVLNMLIAVVFCLGGEAAMMLARRQIDSDCTRRLQRRGNCNYSCVCAAASYPMVGDCDCCTIRHRRGQTPVWADSASIFSILPWPAMSWSWSHSRYT